MSAPKFLRTLSFVGLLTLLVSAGLFTAGCSSTGSSKKGLGEGDGLSEADLDAQREGRFGSGGIPSAEGEGMFRDIRFDYDSSTLDEIARQNVEANAQLLRENDGLAVQLEGHCDERGTAEYNLALGAERARAVKDLLISLGISSTRLDSISYGEEVPLDPGHDEAAWAENRRVHLSPHSGGGSRPAGGQELGRQLY